MFVLCFAVLRACDALCCLMCAVMVYLQVGMSGQVVIPGTVTWLGTDLSWYFGRDLYWLGTWCGFGTRCWLGTWCWLGLTWLALVPAWLGTWQLWYFGIDWCCYLTCIALVLVLAWYLVLAWHLVLAGYLVLAWLGLACSGTGLARYFHWLSRSLALVLDW